MIGFVFLFALCFLPCGGFCVAQNSLEVRGIDPLASRMRSERSTM